jgi:hypothetical protein
VRQSDAHAWAEVWQAGLGWVRVDPTSAVAPGRIGSFERLAGPQDFAGQVFGNLSPTLAAQLRSVWDAANNGWNQWVLNYSQSKQFNLLKNIGFESPSWEDLSYLMIGVIVLAALAGGGWTLWERAQHDPWLRLLGQARRRLALAGIESTPATSPRQLARLALARHGSQAQAAADWLLQLETQRYSASGATARSQSQLRLLKQQLSRLNWPA